DTSSGHWDSTSVNVWGEYDCPSDGTINITYGYSKDHRPDLKQIELSLDLKPALDDKKLDARLIRDFTSRAKEPLTSVLRGLLPPEIIPVCLQETCLNADRSVTDITASERKKLRFWLKNFRIKVTGYRSFPEAIITAGGINTKEINPKTMESRFTKGLFIVGELLDIQADTGGFNLQAAFSTGWVAGESAARLVKS
nr:NAD(P)/FAD-dependent oxidoreductase [Desulfobulbaceae bacterium]